MKIRLTFFKKVFYMFEFQRKKKNINIYIVIQKKSNHKFIWSFKKFH